MVRLRAFASVLVVVLVIALAPGALAGPDPHGGGHGKGKGGGKPSPSPTVEPSPSVQPSPTPMPAEPSADPPLEGTREPPPEARTEDPEEPGTEPGGPGHDRGTGVIKIDGRPFDQAPNNEPHVGCTLEIDLSNYPEGGLPARYTLWLWPPTGHGELARGVYTLQDDPAGGGTDLDGEIRIDLADELAASGVEPHHVQGWHVKVRVHVPHSSGADVKHKVFWVSCRAAAPVTPPPPTVAPPPTVGPGTVTPPAPLAFAGREAGGLAATALLALVLGTGALWASSRLRRTD